MLIQSMSYLTDPNKQFVTKGGALNVNGIVRVFLAGTDDPVKTYCDFNGTRNPQDIRLDNNGRAIIIADVTKAYRVEVLDSNGGLLWTVEPAYCIGGEGGGTPVAVLVPLVRVVFHNGAWSKISGDDGFIKPNPWGVDSLFLPESCWWSIGVALEVANNTPRDLIQHLQIEYEWNSYLSIDVPPITYGEIQLPIMTYEADFTRANTNKRYGTTLYKKDGATEDWLSVALTAYHDTLPNDLEWAMWMNIFKVRDA